jgi:putative transposase
MEGYLPMKLTVTAVLDVARQQHRVLDRMTFAVTKLWNIANWERRQVWDQTGKIPNYYEQEKALRDNPLAQATPSPLRSGRMQKLDQSYRAWFPLRKTDPTANPSGFRKKESLSTITLKESAFRVEGETLRLTVPKSVKEELNYREPFLVI